MKLKYRFMLMDFQDHLAAVPMSSGKPVEEGFCGVIELNQTAASVFRLLQDDTSAEAIVEELEKEYDAPKETLAAAVEKCIHELESSGLLEM